MEKRLFETIFEDCEYPMYIIDANGTILKLNNAFTRFFGYPKSEFVGKNVLEFPKNHFLSSNTVLTALKTGKRMSSVEKTASNRALAITALPVFSERHRVEQIVCKIKDVTEKEKEPIREDRNKRTDQLVKQTSEDEVILNSQKIRDVFSIGKRVAQVDSTVFILGETGVGKNVLARKIHEHSKRKHRPFIEVNCGAISETLLESELFGYEGGAFTGARREGRKGYLEMAHTGTIFLDEIGEMAKSLQVKLLHFLQNKTITRVGGSLPIQLDVRVIAATNQNIKEMVKRGDFRADLYYRLNVVPIEFPPLRERKEDIIPLAFYFLNRFKKKYNIEKEFSHDVIDAFLQYDWPGNVRELQNVIERLVVVTNDRIIGHDDLPEEMLKTANEHLEEELEAEKILTYYKKYKSTYKAAEALGMSQSTFFRKLRRYKAKVQSKRGVSDENINVT